MAIWVKKSALYIDVSKAGGAACLLTKKASTLASAKPVYIQGDKFRQELYFRQVAASTLNASSTVELPAGSKVVFSGKLNTQLDSETLLFSCFDFVADGAGDDLCYYAELDLGGSELFNYFDQNDETSADVLIDIEVQNSDNTDRLTFQFAATVKQQVYDTEPATEPGTPPHYNAPECEARFVPRAEDQAWTRWANGRWYHYVAATGFWYPEVAQQKDGIIVLALSQEGVAL